MQLGHSSISTYGLAEILYSVGASDISGIKGFEGYGHDLGNIFTKEDISRVKPLVQKCIQNMALSKAQLRALEKCIDKETSDKFRAELVKVLGEDTVKSIEEIVPVAENLTDTIAYILVSDMVHFDGLMNNVMKYKKCDAKVYVLGLFNPMQDFTMTYNLEGTTIKINLRDVLDVMFDIINEYYRVYSEYSCKYYYVPPADNVETYGDLLAMGGDKAEDVAAEFITALLNNGTLEDADADTQYKAEKLAPILIKLAQVNTIDLNDVIGSKDIDSISLDESLLTTITPNENGELNCSETAKLAGKALAFTMLQGVYVHPSQAGHDALAKNLITAMENPRINKSAIRYHAADISIRYALSHRHSW